MRNECARREADHERIVSSIKREAESAGRLARDEVQHQNAEALHSAQKQLEALTAERDAANSALQAAEENTERITKQAAARNSQVNMTLKSKDMELAQLRAEQQRLQDLLTSSEDFQALLQMQLVSSREQKHLQARKQTFWCFSAVFGPKRTDFRGTSQTFFRKDNGHGDARQCIGETPLAQATSRHGTGDCTTS